MEKATKDEATTNGSKDPSFAAKTWDKLGLNVGMLMLMAKGSLPPTIAIALYENTAFAMNFLTAGYLVAIMSVLSSAIMPRAKFIQTMVINIIGVCIGAAIALLTIYCSVQARAHTTPAPQSTSGGPTPVARMAGYNSSAAAVCAIWLFANIYFINALRASRPQLQFPSIVYSIFVTVASTSAPQFVTMQQGIAFVKQLLEAFLSGFAIAAMVSLLVFPMTSRNILFQQMAGFISGLQGALKAQASYLQSLENKDMFGASSLSHDDSSNIGTRQSQLQHENSQQGNDSTAMEAEKLKIAFNLLGELHGKIAGELVFAKREIAYGKLDGAELKELFKLTRGVFLPLAGMSSIADIFNRVAESRGWKSADPADPGLQDELEEKNIIEETKDKEKKQWNDIMKSLHGPFEVMTQAMDEGLQHTLYTLELAKPPSAKTTPKIPVADQSSRDVEAQGDIIEPGDKRFAIYLTRRIDSFYDQRKLNLAIWCRQNGVKLDENLFKDPALPAPLIDAERADLFQHQKNQRQLYLILFMEFLLWSTGRAVLDLVRFADLKVEEGIMKKKRFIFPSSKRTKKWIYSTVKVEDTHTEQTPDIIETGGTGIYVGDSFKAAKDPEHLPPTNSWERFGNAIRAISHQLSSPESAFGFRVACATLTIGILAYLHDTQQFFVQQRLVWAMIMVSIGMTTTAGSGVFGFLGRIAGTAIAMCTSLVIWYIVDGKTGGVITMLWFFIFVELYFLIRYPRFTVIVILSVITQILIVGYELEVRKIGVKAATSNGQPAYPIYLLAPYRLACVAGGMLVAFIWTFFPYPITERSQLRKDLGASLYLLANFYSVVHTTVRTRILGEEGDLNDKSCPGNKLEKVRSKVYAKQMSLLGGLRQHSAYTSWEPTFGGKFPKAQYDIIIQGVQNIQNYMSLISYASKNLCENPTDAPTQQSWIKDFSRLLASVNVTSHEITSILALLSASVSSGSPLPPYLQPPQAFKLSERLEALDADILSINHISEPGYAGFAVMQTASSMISDDMRKLIKNVKALVGEVDFTYHVISTASPSDDSLETLVSKKGKKD